MAMLPCQLLKNPWTNHQRVLKNHTMLGDALEDDTELISFLKSFVISSAKIQMEMSTIAEEWEWITTNE
jgi:hypothetical protein